MAAGLASHNPESGHHLATPGHTLATPGHTLATSGHTIAANRLGIGGRAAVMAAPEFAMQPAATLSRSASLGPSGPVGPTRHPPPPPPSPSSSHYQRERMNSAGSISGGNNRGSQLDLRQLDAELGGRFVIIILDIFTLLCQ